MQAKTENWQVWVITPNGAEMICQGTKDQACNAYEEIGAFRKFCTGLWREEKLESING